MTETEKLAMAERLMIVYKVNQERMARMPQSSSFAFATKHEYQRLKEQNRQILDAILAGKEYPEDKAAGEQTFIGFNDGYACSGEGYTCNDVTTYEIKNEKKVKTGSHTNWFKNGRLITRVKNYPAGEQE